MVHSAKMGGALKILERMVNQNAEDEIFQDFKYWEVRHERRPSQPKLVNCQASLNFVSRVCVGVVSCVEDLVLIVSCPFGCGIAKVARHGPTVDAAFDRPSVSKSSS